jgi:microsomal dipeptidase-like Zn-dependent dipeptidase/anthranilate/para-aminobenzoate synthase component II
MFNLQAHLNQIHQQFPPAQTKPVIGITANYEDQKSTLASTYYDSVIKAGGVPVIIPPTPDQHVIINTLQHIDALILSGGGDINPLWCGEDPIPELHSINQQRDLPELLITRLAYNRQIPILGICRGIQTLAVALGGKVAQHISTNIKHSQDADRTEPTHYVTIEEDSTLYNIYKEHMLPLQSEGAGGRLLVNSFHHQAVSEAGSRFRVVARANDGIVEAIESTEYKSIIGVQWHPECLDDGLPLFEWLVREAKSYHDACALHHDIVTLDSHCDTPMFFPQGVDFGSRDERLLVDLHKMTEGYQDATIMVAYLPQSLATSQPKGCRQFADNIFDKIEEITCQHKEHIAIAKDYVELVSHKETGRKSIMLGIENGIALEGDLKNLKHFADRGIVYMTLCHNGDNDICDSAKGSNTHNGVSDFGKKVIREMNKLGIMVDLSHASEKSFYDALEISQQPIVCSHSSCRALCDHPRNLTDDQMRALAKKGGIMQITLYTGFLRSDGDATMEDVMAHLEHAIEVMGIDHVGIGTDFDGDGGVRGLANASELLNLTRQLMARGYSDDDIQKIWGGNFLQLMTKIQINRN